MANESSPKGRGIKVAPGSSERAPFIYFDGVATIGVNAGAVQLELTADAVVPEGTGTRREVLITAHMRCSPTAAMKLRDCLNKVLEIAAASKTIDAFPHAKPN